MGVKRSFPIRRLNILVKFGGLTAVLLIWCAAIGVYVGSQLNILNEHLSIVTEIAHPRTVAAYEMEINTIGTGLAVAKYLHQPDPTHIARIQEDSDEFTAFLKDYQALATSERERSLLAELGDHYDEFHMLGLDLVAGRDRQQEVIRSLSGALVEMEEIVEVSLWSAIGGAAAQGTAIPEAIARLRQALEEYHKVLVAIVWRLEAGDGGLVEATRETTRNALTTLSGAGLGAEQDQQIARLTRQLEAFEPDLIRLFANEAAIAQGFQRLVDLRTLLDDLLDDEIQLLAGESLKRANHDLEQSVRSTGQALLTGAAGTLLAFVLTIGFVSRSFVVPIRRLVEAAKLFGRGTLDHRVELRNRDELGTLATALNQMAARIQQAYAKRDRVNAKLESLVTERTGELTRANRALEEELKTRLAMEAELRQAWRKAEDVNRTKTAFMANMSHELRTPLNAILGFTEMIKMKLFGPLGDNHYEEYVQDIHESGQHLLKLINDVLDVSAIELGQIAINAAQIDIATPLRESLELTVWRANQKNIAVETRLPDQLPPVWADGLRLTQVFANLIDNALKFSPEGSTVSIAAASLDNDRLAVTIADQGPGMAIVDGGSLVESFETGNPAMADDNKGTGLGLAISKRLVEMQGGSQIIESAFGHGTTVTVTLPLRPAEKPATQFI